MWSESGPLKDVPRTHDPETVSPIPRGPASEPRQVKRPFTGGYYWLPIPDPDAGGIIWSVVTCRDLGCSPDAGHDADLWPRLIDRLATRWGKDAQDFRRRLRQSYTGLPRGRVTRPERVFLVLHGDDSPDAGWLEMVIGAFSLGGRRVKPLFDEHETRILGHPQAVENALGLRLYGSGI